MADETNPPQPGLPPTVFDKQYFIKLAVSLLRHFLTSVGTWFTVNNIGTEGQWELLLTGLASLLVGGALILWSKYRDRIKFLTCKGEASK